VFTYHTAYAVILNLVCKKHYDGIMITKDKKCIKYFRICIGYISKKNK